MSEEYILTEEECLAKGGHIWETRWSLTTSTMGGIPTKEQPETRQCKYCGHKQIGYYLPMIWEDSKED